MDLPDVQDSVLAPPARVAHAPSLTVARLQVWAVVAGRLAYGVAALALLVLGLELLKEAASGVADILDRLSAQSVPNMVGFGWLGSYVLMSGSPVAAMALSLYAGGATSDIGTFAMICGTRLGASLSVVFVGFLYYLRRRRQPDPIYVGVVALLTAVTLWVPVIPLGSLLIRSGWLDGTEFRTPEALTSFSDLTYGRVADTLGGWLPGVALFGLGTALLLGSFHVFDRALPNLEQPGPSLTRLWRVLQRRYAMFLLGLLVTAVTLSVSLSLTLLVPLSLKGYVKRENIIPYVMGANISTWVDTLFVAVLVDAPGAFAIVLAAMIAGSVVSLAVLAFLYQPYQRLVLRLAHAVTASPGALALFLGTFLAVPLVLLLI